MTTIKTIKIDRISEETVPFGKKVILESGKLKYFFFDTLKAGGQTKAYTQYKSADWGVGDAVSVNVDEQKKTFTGKDGNIHDSTERRILYFQDTEQGPGTPKVAPKTPQEAPKQESGVFTQTPVISHPTEDNRFKLVEAEIAGLRNRIDGVEKELNDQRNEGTNPF